MCFDGFMWLSEDQRTNATKHTCLKEIGLHLQGYINYSMFKLNTIARTYVFSQGINKHTFFIIIYEYWEV